MSPRCGAFYRPAPAEHAREAARGRELSGDPHVIWNVRRRAFAGFIAVLLVAGCGSGVRLPADAHPRADVVLTQRDFGRTIALHVGQTVGFDLPAWGLAATPSAVLERISGQPVSGVPRLRAVAVGGQLITAELAPMISCGYECNVPAPRYGSFFLVIVPVGQVFDLAASELDDGKAFLANPGMRIIVAAPASSLSVNDPTVLKTESAGGSSTLSILSAINTGRSRVSGASISFDVLVRPADAMYDMVMTDKEKGQTIRLKVGLTLQFELADTTGYVSWTGPSHFVGGVLTPLLEPANSGRNTVSRLGYVIRAEGYETVGFEQDPQCWGEPNCQLPPKLVQFVIAAVQ